MHARFAGNLGRPSGVRTRDQREREREKEREEKRAGEAEREEGEDGGVKDTRGRRGEARETDMSGEEGEPGGGRGGWRGTGEGAGERGGERGEEERGREIENSEKEGVEDWKVTARHIFFLKYWSDRPNRCTRVFLYDFSLQLYWLEKNLKKISDGPGGSKVNYPL